MDPDPTDNAQRILYKILNNLVGVITGAYGFLVRGTLEIAPSTTTTPVTVSYGTKTITTAGTAEKLVANSTLCNSVILSPSRAATGRFFYGSTSASTAQTVELPVTLIAPDGKKIDLSLIWIDATVNGEAVVYETVT